MLGRKHDTVVIGGIRNQNNTSLASRLEVSDLRLKVIGLCDIDKKIKFMGVETNVLSIIALSRNSEIVRGSLT